MKTQGKHDKRKKTEDNSVKRNSALQTYLFALRERLSQKQFWLWLGLGSLLMLPLGVFPMYTVYLQNTDSLTLGAVLSPITTTICAFLGGYIFCAFVTGRPSYSALVSGLFMSFLMNFGKVSTLFEKLFSPSLAMAFSFIIGVAVTAAVAIFLWKFFADEQVLRFFSSLLTVMFLGLLLMNSLPLREKIQKDIIALRSAPQTVHAVSTLSPEANINDSTTPTPEEEALAVEKAESLKEERRLAKEKLLNSDLSFGTPNLYVFVIDEMAGFSAVEKYYNYDLSSFKTFCDANNVNYSSTSHSMYTFTSYCLTDICNYTDNYVSINGSDYSLSWQSLLHKDLSNLGFSLYSMAVSNTVFAGLPRLFDVETVITEHTTEDGLTAEDIAFENSFMKVLLNGRKPYQSTAGEGLLSTEDILSLPAYSELAPYYQNQINQTLKILDFFKDPESYTPNVGLGLFTYLKSTHVPFVFQADGSLNADTADHRNWRDIEVYNGTYTFTLRNLEVIFNTIIDNDPDSIVLVLSDHGVRQHYDCTLKHQFAISEKDQRNVMSLLYFRGLTLDIEGLSATDNIRVVLNLLGKDLPLQGDKTMEDVIQ